MKPNFPAPRCAVCDSPAVLVPKLTRFRRGERVLPYEGFIWECATACPDPVDGLAPYQFSTMELMEWEEARAAEAWLERFGEPMPEPQRARKAEDRRTVRVPVLLTPAEAERLDELRGERARGEFLRQLLTQPKRRAG